MSTFAGETARIILFGFAMYSEMRFLVCFSISVGWSPIGTWEEEAKSAHGANEQIQYFLPL